MKQIAIIGSGVAGLSCALELEPAKFRTTFFDMNDRTGGRVTTQNSDDYQFDYGAQYISNTTSPFRMVLDNWLEEDIIEEWDGVLGELQGSRFVDSFDNKPVYVGKPQNSEITSYLVSKLGHAIFNLNTKIVNVFKKFNEWYLVDDNEEIYGGYDFIVVTLPPPLAKELLSEYEYLVTILDEVHISPRWAVMIGLKHRLNVDYDGVFVNNSPIRWMARNNSKPGRPEAESWVIHTSKRWSRSYLKEKPEWVAKRIYKEFLNITGFEKYETEFKSVFRWDNAIVETPLDQNFILDNNRNIGLAGDYCIGNNIEAAYLSGQNLGARINLLRI